MTSDLSQSERNVLRSLERAAVKHRNPSLAEIRSFTAPTLALSSIRAALVRLANKGYVELSAKPGQARQTRQIKPSPAKSKAIKVDSNRES